MTGIFCAIDAPGLEEAKKLAGQLAGAGIGLKIGLELFTAEGPACVAELRRIAGEETPVFLDLKLHDIPNTVAGAARAAVRCRADFLTIHASGGAEMMRAAAEAARAAAAKLGVAPPQLLGVTVLTSMDDAALQATGQETPAAEQVLRLAQLAQDAGLQGVVCSPHEIAALRDALARDMLLVVPGIRPQGAGKGDQKRTMTPAEAARLGADWLVIGRPITQAPSPAAAAREILAQLDKRAA